MPTADGIAQASHWIAQRSFRLKLFGLVLLVQAVALALTLWQGRALLETQLMEQVQQRIGQINPLLNAAIALPLAQRDYAAVNEIAQQTMTGHALAYLAIDNREGKPIARIGWPPAAALPHERIDVEQDLALYGEPLGKARYGVPLDFLAVARAQLESRTLQIGALAAALSLVLLAALTHGLFRRVAHVEAAAKALAAGDMTRRIAAQGDSEIDHLGQVFNGMADALQARIDEIHQLNADLETRVAARTAELSVARDEAERLMRVKSEFLANMSHEIRTPLNGVLGMAHIGRRKCVDAEASRAFEQILRSGDLLLGIINDILDLSKIEAGKLTVERTPFVLAETLEHAVDLLRDRAQAKGLALTLDIAPDLPQRCVGDALRLGQILLNLLGNAVKFTERGQVSLTAHRSGNDRLQLQIADTGIGMGADQIERLFQPFEQAESSTTRRFGGTGLGLAISKRLVELMGGEIRVSSHPGTGSTFTVSLPLDAAPDLPSPIAAPGAVVLKRLAGLRILVAEDEAVNRLVLEDNLIEEGATVTLAENGRLAVAIVAAGREAYDLVLMDVMMPEMDGLEATRQIVQLAPDLPVIGQTAHALLEEHDGCRNAGMVDLVTKPIDIDLLIAAILRHARRRP